MTKKMLASGEWKKDAAWAAAAIAVSAAITCILFRLWDFNWHVMLESGVDSSGFAALAYLYDTGVNSLALRNAPYELLPSQIAPAMGGFNVYNGLLWVFARIFDGFGLICNALYFFGYLLIPLLTFIALRLWGISRPSAAVCGVIYDFLPYHYMRGQPHYILGLYSMVPLAALALYYAISGSLWDTDGKNTLGKTGWAKKLNRKVFWVSSIGALLIGGSDLYYTFFFWILMVCAAVYAFITDRKWKNLAWPFYLCVIAAFGALITMLPYLMYHFTAQPIPVTADSAAASAASSAVLAPVDDGRGPYAAEYYTVRFLQLILPITGHRIKRLGVITQQYVTWVSGGMTWESQTAALGFTMAVGLVVSLLAALLSVRRKKANDFTEKLSVLGLLNMICLVFAIPGGLGCVVVALTFHGIRCYCRLSVYIATFSIMAVALLLDKAQAIVCRRRAGKAVFSVLLAGLMVAAVADQTPVNMLGGCDASKAEQNNISQMVAQIEQTAPENASIFFLPLIATRQELGSGVNDLPVGTQFLPVLYSTDLHWSTLTFDSPSAAIWESGLVGQPMQNVIDAAREKGFSGIYVDERGYKAEEREQIRAELDALLGQPDIISGTGQQYYYDITKE